MAKAGAERKVEIPPHDDAADVAPKGSEDEVGVEIDLDSLKAPERGGAKSGGEDRKIDDPPPEDGGLDLAVESDDRREARRIERQERKAARERREQQLLERVEAAERRVAEVESRRAQDETQNVREQLAQAEREMQERRRQYDEARKMKEEAIAKNDGKSAVEADEVMTAASNRYNVLADWRERTMTAGQQRQQEQQRPRVSATVQSEGKAFLADHSWYKPSGEDRDSAKVISLDRKLAAEGWDPNTKGYWEELRDRVKEELPHRFGGARRAADDGDDEDRPAPRKQVTGGSGRESGGDGGGGNTFKLSAARVRAIKEAGMWDDSAQRTKMIRRYMEHDRQAARRERR